jgi:hypothetical protein
VPHPLTRVCLTLTCGKADNSAEADKHSYPLTRPFSAAQVGAPCLPPVVAASPTERTGVRRSPSDIHHTRHPFLSPSARESGAGEGVGVCGGR